MESLGATRMLGESVCVAIILNFLIILLEGILKATKEDKNPLVKKYFPPAYNYQGPNSLIY